MKEGFNPVLVGQILLNWVYLSLRFKPSFIQKITVTPEKLFSSIPECRSYLMRIATLGFAQNDSIAGGLEISMGMKGGWSFHEDRLNIISHHIER